MANISKKTRSTKAIHPSVEFQDLQSNIITTGKITTQHVNLKRETVPSTRNNACGENLDRTLSQTDDEASGVIDLRSNSRHLTDHDTEEVIDLKSQDKDERDKVVKDTAKKETRNQNERSVNLQHEKLIWIHVFDPSFKIFYSLLNLHKDVISGRANSGWLDNRLINYSLFAIKKKYCSSSCLIHCPCTERLFIPEQNQHLFAIINTHPPPGQHWILLEIYRSNQGCPCCDVFDSDIPKTTESFLPQLFLSRHVTRLLNSLLDQNGDHQICVNIMKCPQQNNGNDCGVYAIANLITNIENKKIINNIKYTNDCRSHLYDCCDKFDFCMFPFIELPSENNRRDYCKFSL